MKKHYRKYYDRHAKHRGDFYYILDNAGYYRGVRTFGEIRRNVADHTDHRDEKLRYRDRSSGHMLDAWNDFPIGKGMGRSWKTFTKHRKQWMVGRDKGPVLSPWCRWDAMLGLGLHGNLPWIAAVGTLRRWP